MKNDEERPSMRWRQAAGWKRAAALCAAIPDLDARERRGQIEIRDASEWYDVGANPGEGYCG